MNKLGALDYLKGTPVDLSKLSYPEAMEKLWQLTAEGWEVTAIEVWGERVTAYVQQVLEKFR